MGKFENRDSLKEKNWGLVRPPYNYPPTVEVTGNNSIGLNYEREHVSSKG